VDYRLFIKSLIMLRLVMGPRVAYPIRMHCMAMSEHRKEIHTQVHKGRLVIGSITKVRDASKVKVQ